MRGKQEEEEEESYLSAAGPLSPEFRFLQLE